ncbi:SPOR domain-containing protein [Shewanella livingstonensis]|uniref:SPOR domain-containing protein n=1 Tax=Shewanella livingstonensis TaxID=150120 RepID=A0A3G8LYQ5_9GAMM|nr:SPOR domain-containing protein [Shewanella livingstonensis]AZG73828.1 SPOR domain-containing protein [Shewanella livingstonensis]
MNRQFQNRLVGTIVLVALGVIFLPDLLDGKQPQVVEEFTEIPLRPASLSASNRASAANNAETVEEFQVLTIAEPKDLSNDIVALGEAEPTKEPVKEVSQIAKQPVPVAPIAKQPEVQVANKIKSPVTAGFTLQLGGFNNITNVKALIIQLRKAGFNAYTLPKTPVEGKLTRVFVGPEVSEEKLKARQQPIFKLTGLKGKIVTYNPQEQ